MKFLPKKIYLALNTALFIACYARPDSPLTSTAIETHCALKRRSLEPVLRKLCRENIITSERGTNGGYYIADPSSVTVGDIVRCFITEDFTRVTGFSDFIDTLQPHMAAGYTDYLESMFGITMQMLADDAKQNGLPDLRRKPALDFVI